MAGPRWLRPDEMQVWRDWLLATTRIQESLDRELQEAFGRSMAEYEVLVRLSESPERRSRMSELATASLQSRSRLTHTIDRLEACGLVERRRCDDDRRGTWALLTDEGFAKLEEMAPVHVAGVRRHLIDVLGPDALEGFGAGLARLRAEVERPA